MTLRHQLAGSLSAFLILLSPSSHAESGRSDYDLDNDGLIEINDLADLDEIRNNLDGSSLYASSDGCPAEGCNGFELTTDLDFDTNGDGTITELDDYWNRGEGWLPIGDSSNKFSAIFDGSYHTIDNFHFNRSTSNVGLFGEIDNAKIRRLRVDGSITGRSEVGLIVGEASNSALSELIAYGEATATYTLGGIAGDIKNSTLFASAAHIRLSSNWVGALVGRTDQDSTLEAVYATGSISHGSAGGAGGFINSGRSNTTIKNSYTAVHLDGLSKAAIAYIRGRGVNSHWVTDYINTTRLGASSKISNGGGFSLAELTCPTTANNTDCADTELYSEWETSTYEDGSPVWDFGTGQQLPALIWNGAIIRDTDNDGILDEDDDFPHNYAAYKDSDNDGYPDFWTAGCNTECQNSSGLTVDHLPYNIAASLDADADNQPEAWNSSCNQTCQQNSGLVIDASPNDRNNKNGSDLTDNDDNDDGQIDADADSNGLIEISTLEQFRAIRFQSNGAGRRLSGYGEIDSSGCPLAIIDGYPKAQCIGYELVNDLDFDTNNNGKFDHGDSFWNDSKGFVKIPALHGILEGNGFKIRNLTIHSTEPYENVAIFGELSNAEIRNLAFINSSVTSTRRRYEAAGIALLANNASLHKVLFSGSIEIQSLFQTTVGGIIGHANEGVRLNEVAFIGSVTSDPLALGRKAGLIGTAISDYQITNSFVSAVITGQFASALLGGNVSGETPKNSFIENSYFSGTLNGTYNHAGNGPLLGIPEGTTTFNNNYWVKGSHQNDNGSTLSELTCPVAASDTNCADTTLYQDWSEEIWDFGNSNQTPALTIAGEQYRDSDGDGVDDASDNWPLLYAAHEDADQDGYPDSWSPHCDSECVANSGLQLDGFPQHQEIWSDSDLDGMPELCDASCAATLEGTGISPDPYANDVDNDGIPDAEDEDTNGVLNADSNGNGLIDIRTLADLDAMRFQLEGAAKVVSETADPDSTGCPIMIHNGQNVRRCQGYELVADLDFDSNGDGAVSELDDYWNDGKGWSPIGNEAFERFRCEFSGNGHRIDNLYINNDEYAWRELYGLFSKLEDARIHNLIITGRILNSGHHAGLLAGNMKTSTINNIVASGEVYSESDTVGLIAGVSVNSSINNVMAFGQAKSDTSYTGGIIGRAIESTISNSYSLVLTPDGKNPVAPAGNLYTSIVNSIYWQNTSISVDIPVSYDDTAINIGSFSLRQLQCPIQAETSVNSSACHDNEDVILFSGWDASQWDFGTNQQLPALKVGDNFYRDSDGDGVIDTNDEKPYDFDNDSVNDLSDGYPFISIGALTDADQDGIPDDCDPSCIALGMTADEDDDNDLIPDESDGYPNVAIGDYPDNDKDGRPDSCDTNCQATGMAADPDDDNDGIDDINDDFPLIAAASIDADHDGLPDKWADGCDFQCQSDSGLSLDTQLSDTDNDGVINSEDPDNEADNGKPTIIAVGPTMYTPVNNEDGSAYIASAQDIDRMLSQLSASDVVDTSDKIRFRAYLNGTELVENTEAEVIIPAGKQIISWVAEDSSGNRSDAMEQQVNIYPQIKFSFNSSLIGEPDTAKIALQLTGPSPEYPVDIPVKVVIADSTASQDDVNESFDITKIHMVRIERGSAETPPTTASIAVPVLQEFADEQDETLILNIVAKPASKAPRYFSYALPEDGRRHTLTIVDMKDTDRDGLPDECDVDCLNAGKTADDDDDGDSVIDSEDRFPLIAAASIDADHDGLPDKWADSCDFQCQSDSGLSLDTQLNDTDNDGVINSEDPDNEADNGKPTIIAVGPTMYTPVNNEDGSAYIASAQDIDRMLSQLSASDVVDTSDKIRFRAYLNGTELVENTEAEVIIPAGKQIISWVAEDSSGNRSDAMEQQVNIYPQIKFSFNSSLIGEPDTAKIALQLTGPSPEYPVDIPVKVVIADSTASQDDVNESFDITDTHVVRIERGNAETPPTTASIAVPVLQEFADEQDETLILNIAAKPASKAPDDFSYTLPEDGRRHTLTIVDMKDTDRDGLPDECDVDCLNAGKTADDDDDNDGITDVLDGYPIVAIGNHADFDGDGRPDTCDNTCQASGMMADPDDDNDGINDVDDAFRLNAAASIDVDKDGLPDSWNSACSSSCRTGSGLMLDAQLNDTDNDGVKNDIDTDNNTDNGKPTLVSVAPVWYSPVNNEDGTAHILSAANLNLMTGQLVATDIVDTASAIRYQGILNGSALDLTGNTNVEIPVGLQTISWYAIDGAGNRSVAKEQKVYIYPEVRFSLAQSQSTENVNAEIQIELSGISPEYPVEVPVKLNLDNSTTSALDLAPEFEATAIHTVVIELGDGEAANTTGNLQIPILEDNISEQDETLQIQIASKPNSQGGNQFGYALPDDGRTHLLTITEMNLPPAVTLVLRQGGEIISEVKQDAGLVTLTAVVTDPNIQDQHVLAWDLNDLGLAAQAGETVTVNPQGLPVQEYKVVVTATDNATPPLSAQAEISFEVKAATTEPTPGDGSGSDNGSDGDNSGSESSGGGGGAIHLWYLMMLFIGVYGLRRRPQ
ncbi:hypothetical protein [Bacterioplanoides pacificum]|uniref:Uncharacterized protein n=1 Tax=Bacterioplanoides pacificum TaxID=1171596 RepID=A0ABV7VNN0_9GAMM